MNTLITVIVVLLIGLGYVIGTLVEKADYNGRLSGHIAHWRSRAGTFNAQAKELEQEHRLGEQHECQLKAAMLLDCANALTQEITKEPRRII